MNTILLSKEVDSQTALTSLMAGHDLYCQQDKDTIEQWSLGYQENLTQVKVRWIQDNQYLDEVSSRNLTDVIASVQTNTNIQFYLPIRVADQVELAVLNQSHTSASHNTLLDKIDKIYHLLTQEKLTQAQEKYDDLTAKHESQNVSNTDEKPSYDETVDKDVDVQKQYKTLTSSEHGTFIQFNVNDVFDLTQMANTNRQRQIIEDVHLPSGMFGIEEYIAVIGDKSVCMNNGISGYQEDITDKIDVMPANANKVKVVINNEDLIHLKDHRISLLINDYPINFESDDKSKKDEAISPTSNQIEQSTFVRVSNDSSDFMTVEVSLPPKSSTLANDISKGLEGYIKTHRILNTSDTIKAVAYNNKSLKRVNEMIDTIYIYDEHTIYFKLKAVSRHLGQKISLTLRFKSEKQTINVGDSRLSLQEVSKKNAGQQPESDFEQIKQYLLYIHQNGSWFGDTIYDKDKQPLAIIKKNYIGIITKSLNQFFNRKITRYSKTLRNEIVHHKDKKKNPPVVALVSDGMPNNNTQSRSYQCIRLSTKFLQESQTFNLFKNKMYKS